MGRLKESWIEASEDRHITISKVLGITYQELEKLAFEIQIESTKEGLISCYRLEFDESCPKDILNKIERLENGVRVYLQPWELDSDYDYEEQYDAVSSNKNYFSNFKNEVLNLRSLLQIDISDVSLKEIFNRQMFVSVISTMETYLSDAFINNTLQSKDKFRRFVETHPEFKNIKFELRDIFVQSRKIEEIAKKVMLDSNYHNLPIVKRMYEDVFQIDFPDIDILQQFVSIRHDLVHRNGKTRSGESRIVDDMLVKDLIYHVEDFVSRVENKIIFSDDIPF